MITVKWSTVVLLLVLTLLPSNMSGAIVYCQFYSNCPVAYYEIWVMCDDFWLSVMDCCQDGCNVVNWYSCANGNPRAECHRWDFCWGIDDSTYVLCQ